MSIKWSAFTNAGELKASCQVVGLTAANNNARFDFPGTGIKDDNDVYLFRYLPPVGTAANFLTINSSIAGQPISLTSNGSDTNVGITIAPKGSGDVTITTSPTAYTVISSVSAIKMPIGTTGQRPAGINGIMRFNSTTSKFEYYDPLLAMWVNFLSDAVPPVTSVTGTANRIDVTGTTIVQIDISNLYVGQTSLTTLGTITTGTWHSTLIGSTYGGTGVNNGASTITVGGNVTVGSTLTTVGAFSTAGAFSTVGAFTAAFTMTGNTAVTFPTSGTLATTAGGSIPAVVQGDLLYGSAANVLSALAKNTSATRYLSNTGTSNNPAWAQVALTTGVTGILPPANGGTGNSGLTLNSIPIVGASGELTQDNPSLYWSSLTLFVTNIRPSSGINSTSVSTGSMIVPFGGGVGVSGNIWAAGVGGRVTTGTGATGYMGETVINTYVGATFPYSGTYADFPASIVTPSLTVGVWLIMFQASVNVGVGTALAFRLIDNSSNVVLSPGESLYNITGNSPDAPVALTAVYFMSGTGTVRAQYLSTGSVTAGLTRSTVSIQATRIA